LISWIRENKNVKAIKAETEIENSSSVKVLKKSNFQVMRQINKAVILRLELN